MSEENHGPTWISAEVVRKHLTWEALVPAISGVLASLTTPGTNEQPLRTRLRDQHTQGIVITMPGLHHPTRALAVKVLGFYPHNAPPTPTHSATVLLLDSQTGAVKALLDGDSITELRTAAASAAATAAIRKAKLLPTNCSTVAVLGAGVQGASHARVMNSCLHPTEVRIWSRPHRSASGEEIPSPRTQELVLRLREEGVPAVACCSVEESVRDADVINCCSSASEPILEKEWIRPSAHINSVGATSPTQQDISTAVMAGAEVFPDSEEAASNESGNVIRSGAEIVAEIGLVMRGLVVPDPNKMSVFVSLGVAVEDAVAADLVYKSLQ